jgi:hypothetical protein
MLFTSQISQLSVYYWPCVVTATFQNFIATRDKDYTNYIGHCP